MISTDFAPNEQWDDAWISFKLLFQPWRWKYGKETEEVKEKLLQKFQLPIINYQSSSKFQNPNFKSTNVFLFLTGRSALFTILQTLGLPEDSEVIVQAFTCEAVILPILANRLKPVYTDIETKTLSMDPIELGKKISRHTKVVILQHSFGMMPIQRSKIQSLVREHKLLLIEDIAHGYSNPPKGKLQSKVEGQKSKVIYLMSFGRSKAISSVYGGAVITNSSQIIEHLNKIQPQKPMPSSIFIFRLLLYKPLAMMIKSTYDYGFGKILHKITNFLKILVPEITQKEKRGDYNQILDKAYPNALAILLLNQLKKFEQVQQHRALITTEYNKIFNSQFSIFKEFSNSNFQFLKSPLIRYPLLVDQPQKLLSEASRQNIFLGEWYDQVVAPKSLDLKKVCYEKGSCPKAEDVCQKIINLPTNITTKEAVGILSFIK